MNLKIPAFCSFMGLAALFSGCTTDDFIELMKKPMFSCSSKTEKPADKGSSERIKELEKHEEEIIRKELEERFAELKTMLSANKNNIAKETPAAGTAKNTAAQEGFLYQQSATKTEQAVRLSEFTDTQKIRAITDIVKAFSGKYTFPVLNADNFRIREAFSVGRTYFEFGGERGIASLRNKRLRHKGCDFYGYGKDVVAFADGVVADVGRHKNNFDHGNIIAIEHGKGLMTYYIHIGGIQDKIQKGYAVKMGEAVAKVDCTGISTGRGRLYNPGSHACREKAHLHFQVKLGNSYINPVYFFPEFSKARTGNLRGYRLSIPAGDIEYKIFPFHNNERCSSFCSASPLGQPQSAKTTNTGVQNTAAQGREKEAQQIYNACRPLFHTKKADKCPDWESGASCFEHIVSVYAGTETARKADISVNTLKERLRLSCSK